MHSQKKQLENYLHKHIPISSAMGIHVDHAATDHIILKAPLCNNINHKMTAFGGSLHSAATLACWSLLHVNFADTNVDNVQIVIARSEVDYLAPVSGDFTVQCYAPDVAEWERFMKMLEKRKKARIKLHATVYLDRKVCVDYWGMFVAIMQ